MRTDGFNFFAPDTLKEAFQKKNQVVNSSYLAGGTDFIPLLKYNLKAPVAIISLANLDELKRIDPIEKGIRIGSMVTLREIADSALVATRFPSLVKAARRVATPQIRNSATIGGNILQDRRCIYFNQSSQWRENLAPCFKIGGDVCHQAPRSPVCKALYYSDIAPVLISLDATAIIFDGIRREIPIDDLIASHIEINGLIQSQDFIIEGFFIPECKPGALAEFQKQSLRDSLNFPIINMAFKFTPDSVQPGLRIIVGAVAPEPIELTETQSKILTTLNSLSKERDDIEKQALAELTQKSALVREAGLSIKTKRNSFSNILDLIDKITAIFD
ncbi:MAG: FAD binding domain-containing protein [Saccharofermentanales bacterium]